MPELTVYDSDGKPVGPQAASTSRADGRLREHIHNAVDLMLDPTAGEVVAIFQATTSKVSSTRPTHFHARYAADGDIDLVTGLVEQLQWLETEYEDHDWSLIQDAENGRWAFLWTLEGGTEQPLIEFGLHRREQEAIKQLLEDGQQLEFEVRSYSATAAAINYLRRRVDRPLSVGVSSQGRIGPIQSADVVLNPDGGDGFAAGSQETQTLLDDLAANIESNVESEFERRMLDAISELAATDRLTVWERYSELSDVDRFVRSLWEGEIDHVEIRDDVTTEIVEAATSLRKGERMGDFPDAGLLDEEVKLAVRDRALDYIDEKRRDLESQMKELVVEEFQAAVDDLESDDPDTSYVRYQNARDVVDDVIEVDADQLPDSIDRVRNLEDQLRANDVLTDEEVAEVRETVTDWLSSRTEVIENRREERYLRRFEAAVEDIGYDDVRNATELFTDVREIIDGARDPSEADEVKACAAIVSDLETDIVLDSEARQTLKSDFLDRLSERRSELDDIGARYHEKRLESEVERLTRQRENEDYANVYRRLSQAKQLCSPATDEPQATEDLGDFPNLFRDLEHDQFVSNQQKNRVRMSIEEVLERELENVQTSKRDDLVGTFPGELDQTVSTLVTEVGRTKTLEKLDLFEEYLGATDSDHEASKEDSLRRLCELADEVDGRTHDTQPLNHEQQATIKEQFREGIAEQKRRLREGQKEQLVAEFESKVDEVVNFVFIHQYHKIELLRTIEAHLPESDGGNPDVPVPAEELAESYQVKLRTTWGDIFELINSRYEALTSQQRRDLRSTYGEIASEGLQECQELYAEELLEHAEATLEDEFRSDDASRSLDELERQSQQLQLVGESLERRRLREGPLPDEIEEVLGEIVQSSYLTERQNEQLSDEVGELVEELLQAIGERKQRRAVQLFRDEVRRIKTMDGSPEERIRHIGTVSLTIKGEEPTNPGRLEQDSALLDYRGLLTDEARADLTDDLSSERENAVADLTRSVEDTIGDRLQAYYEDCSDQDPKVGLDMFEEFLVGNLDQYDPGQSDLEQARDRFQQLRELREEGMLIDDEFDDVRSSLVEEVRRLQGGSGGDTGGIRTRVSEAPVLGKLASAAPNERKHQAVLAVVVGAVAVIALAQLGLAGTGALGAGLPGSGQLGGGSGDQPRPAVTQFAVLPAGNQSGEVAVTGEVTGNPSNVRVTLAGPTNQTKTTNVSGERFETRFTGLSPGIYNVTVQVSPEGDTVFSMQLVLPGATENSTVTPRASSS